MPMPRSSISTARPRATRDAVTSTGVGGLKKATAFSMSSASTCTTFQTTAASLYTTFGRRVFIAETGYPSAAMQGAAYSTWNSTVAGYPESPQGQHDFLRDLVAWGASTGVLSDVRPWAPDYCTADWQPMSYFTVSGSLATADAGINAVSDGLIKARTV